MGGERRASALPAAFSPFALVFAYLSFCSSNILYAPSQILGQMSQSLQNSISAPINFNITIVPSTCHSGIASY